MGWNNPPIPWRELERRLSWRSNGTPLPAEPSRSERPSRPPAQPARPAARPLPWAELHVHSAYSFLDGASEPAELVAEAVRLGVETLAITDHDGMYGVVRLAEAVKEAREHDGVEISTVSSGRS